MIVLSSKIPALPGLKSHAYISEKVDRYTVVQKVNSTIHWINLYPVDSAILLPSPILNCSIVIYPMDSAIQFLNNWNPDRYILY